MTVVIAIGLVIGAIISIAWSLMQTTDSLALLINIPGIAIILGGLVLSTYVSYRPNEVFNAFGTIIKSIFSKSINPVDLIDIYVDCSKSITAKGYSALEAERSNFDSGSYDDQAFEMIVAGYKQDDVLKICRNKAVEHVERINTASRLMAALAGAAPGFGMIGTVIGLVVVLKNMGSDVSSIGPAMAVALLTTLYGVFLSTVIFTPMKNNLNARLESVKTQYRISIDGIACLMDKSNYVYTRDLLNSHLLASIKSKK